MSAFEEILNNIEMSRIQNEELQIQLDEITLENQILMGENDDMHYELINLESLIKKFGGEPISLKRAPSKAIKQGSEENKYENDEKIMQFTFEFKIPEEYHKEAELDVNIIGNFTQWIPQPMEKDEKQKFLYRYTALLERGYKHRYIVY